MRLLDPMQLEGAVDSRLVRRGTAPGSLTTVAVEMGCCVTK